MLRNRSDLYYGLIVVVFRVFVRQYHCTITFYWIRKSCEPKTWVEQSDLHTPATATTESQKQKKQLIHSKPYERNDGEKTNDFTETPQPSAFVCKGNGGTESRKAEKTIIPVIFSNFVCVTHTNSELKLGLAILIENINSLIQSINHDNMPFFCLSFSLSSQPVIYLLRLHRIMLKHYFYPGACWD